MFTLHSDELNLFFILPYTIRFINPSKNTKFLLIRQHPSLPLFFIQEGSSDCFGHSKLYAHLLLERILEELGLNTFFSSYKNFTKLQYDVYGFAKLLIFSRLLNPASKCATVRQNDAYYEPILSDFNLDNVYDTLDFIHDNKDIKPLIDFDKVAEYKKSMGYYQIVTSELTMDAQEALNKWKVDKLPGDLYRFMDMDDPDLKLILDAFDINIPLKLYRRSELKKIKNTL